MVAYGYICNHCINWKSWLWFFETEACGKNGNFAFCWMILTNGIFLGLTSNLAFTARYTAMEMYHKIHHYLIFWGEINTLVDWICLGMVSPGFCFACVVRIFSIWNIKHHLQQKYKCYTTADWKIINWILHHLHVTFDRITFNKWRGGGLLKTLTLKVLSYW